jgi:hypothetical protein
MKIAKGRGHCLAYEIDWSRVNQDRMQQGESRQNAA